MKWVRRAVLSPGGLAKPAIGPMFGLIWDGLMYNLRLSRARLEKVLARTFTDCDEEYVTYFGDTPEHVHPDRRFPKVLPDGALAAWSGERLLVVNEHDTVTMEGWAHMPSFDAAAVEPLLERISGFVRRGETAETTGTER